MVGKFLSIEAASVICEAGDLAGGLIAEKGHHRHPAAVAAETIMQVVPPPHMWQCIEGEGDIASPGMGDLDAAQLREAINHIPVEDRRADRRVDPGETRAST